MKISWFWLSQILDLSSTTLNDLEKSLTISGFEIDNIKAIDYRGLRNTVFDIAPIPNRDDLSSTIGIAQEVAVVLRQNLNLNFRNTLFLHNQKNSSRLQYTVMEDCSCYSMVLMKNIQVNISPKWLRDYLIIAGVQPINNILDIRNYIKIKWGQDFQIFDIPKQCWLDPKCSMNIQFSLLEGLAIHVQQSKTVDKILPMTTKNTFDKTDNANLSAKTILIQSAIFDQLSQKKFSEAFYVKYMKNSESNTLLLAMQESVFLYKKFCSGLLEEYHNFKTSLDCKVHIKITKKNLIRILAPTINCNQEIREWEAKVTEILHLLNFNPSVYSTYWLINIPKQRQYDLRRESDIIEEIARIYGFHYFNDILPYTYIKQKISQRELLKRQIRDFLRNIGAHELVHSSLQKQQRINLFNPLNDEYNGLRSNLITGLIDSLYYNMHQSNNNFDGFEIGKIFYKNYTDKVIQEKLHLGMVWGCKNYLRPDWSSKSQSLSWFQAKGIISNLCQSIGVTLFWKKIPKDFYLKKILHSQRTALLYFGQYKVGIFGEVNPLLSYDIGIKQSFYLCELDLDDILYQLKNSNISSINYQLIPYSRYPCVTRDISMIVDINTNISSIMNKIHNINSSFVKSIELFDEYLGNQIPANKRSLSLRVTYQSFNETLTNSQITQYNNYIRDIICKKLNIEIR